MSGWISVDRALFGHDFFAREPMSEREAWIWMLQNAQWEDGTHRVGGSVHAVPRGSFMATLREMQSVFMWGSDTKVRNFLKRLEGENMIERTTVGTRNAPKTHVTVCKYDEYQGMERSGNAPKTHRERTENAVNNNITNNKPSSNEEDARAAYDLFIEFAHRCGWAKPQSKLSVDRRKAISARLRECDGLDGWRHALSVAEASEFISTANWFSIDWMAKPANFRKIMEGNYDNRNSAAPRADHSRQSGTHDSLFAGFGQVAADDDRQRASGSADDFRTDYPGDTEMDFGPRRDDAGAVFYLANAGRNYG